MLKQIIKIMKKFTEEKIKEFEHLHQELDVIITEIVKAKAEYGEYRFNYDSHIWNYDGGLFEIEASEPYSRCDNDNTMYLEITWDEILDVNNIVKRLEREGKERYKKKEEEKKRNAEKEKLRKVKAERENYERLKLKFEK